MLNRIKYVTLCFVISSLSVVSCGDGMRTVLTYSGVCQVTIPNRSAPPCCSTNPSGETCFCPQGSPGTPNFIIHGNGKLWVGGGLTADGKLLVANRDGRGFHEKFMWYRAVSGALNIRGRRLDAPAGPLQAEIPCCYGDTGFQASEVFFPSEGCWEITGQAGNAELTFIVEVRFKT